MSFPLQAMAARGDAAQVLFLGTGCAEPSKYRGGAAVHVRLSDGRGLLLDAGEGALGQLVRHFGPAGAVKQARVFLSTILIKKVMSSEKQ